MQFEEIFINDDFLSVFTVQELEQILPYCFAFDSDSFVVNTEKYFFEVSLNEKNVIISYDANLNDAGGVIAKNTFFQLLEESPVQYPEVVEVEM